jgi:hypothetical protein
MIISLVASNFRTFPKTIKLLADCFGIQKSEPIPKPRSKIVSISGAIIGYIEHNKYTLSEFLCKLRYYVNKIYLSHIGGYMLYGDEKPIKIILYRYKKCVIQVNTSNNKTQKKEYLTHEHTYYSGPETYIINSYSDIMIVPVALDIWNNYTDGRITHFYTLKQGSNESYIGSFSILDMPPDTIVSENNIGDIIIHKKIFTKELCPIILDHIWIAR